MISLLDIKKAINNKLKAAITNTSYSNVSITAMDVTPKTNNSNLGLIEIQRPSLKVDFSNSKNNKFNANCREKTLTCRIYYFAKDVNKYSLDNMGMQDLIENAFLEGLQINEDIIIDVELQSDTVDTVLICDFDIYLLEEIEYNTTAEPIEDLKFNTNLKIDLEGE